VADSEAPEEAPVPRYSPVPRDLGPSEEVLALQGALAQAQADLDALRAEQVALREACAAREPVRAALRAEVLREAEPELVRLALAVAERVLGRELRADPSLLVHWAREAVEALPSRERLTVTLSTDLARVLSEDAWSEALGDGVTISVDPSRSSGTCEVRAGASSVDAGPAGRLGAVREELGE
jgi:flagellar assembly protein FliH